VAREPDIRVRDIAGAVGITERATQAIVRDLAVGGYVEVRRSGRRSHYRLVRGARFPHPILAHAEIGSVLDLLNDLLTGAQGGE
jgi:predicted transcriptional regulator